MSPTTNATSPFGALLRHHRLSAGLSQEALAERAGISAPAIAALERGRRVAPRPETLLLLSRALVLTPEDQELFLLGTNRNG